VTAITVTIDDRLTSVLVIVLMLLACIWFARRI